MLIAALLACAAPEAERPAEGGPAPALQFTGERPTNLLFLSIDTLRRDHVGPWSDRGLTPFVDTLAAEGVVFADHQTCSHWTLAGVTCTLAGRSHVERGHIPRLFGPPDALLPVPADTPLLAGWLAEAGFTTVAASSNKYFGPEWGNDQGYGTMFPFGGGALNGWAKVATTVEAADGPWFGHLHLFEPHEPYVPPEEWFDRSGLPPWPWEGDPLATSQRYIQRQESLSEEEHAALRAYVGALYDGEVRHTDDLLRQILGDAEARGLLDDTLVVVWTDHGEQLWDHGAHSHAHALHGEENDGVWIAWGAGLVPGVHTGPTHATDVAPTVLDALGVPIPEVVSGSVAGLQDPGRLRFTAGVGRDGGVQAVQQGRWRLHFDWATGRRHLYDRAADPGEQDDRFAPDHPAVEALWPVLRDEAEAMRRALAGGAVLQWPE